MDTEARAAGTFGKFPGDLELLLSSDMRREVYYNEDVSKPPEAGDKFIQLDWEESTLSLEVFHGIFPDGSSRKATRRFPTLDKLHEAIGKYREDAVLQGFKLYAGVSEDRSAGAGV
jgi:hypothetical protein